MLGYCFIKDPTSWEAYALSVFQAGSGLSIVVSMLAYLQKRIPKMIRGMTMAVIQVSGSIGSILYLQLEQRLIDDGNRPYMVFGTIIIIDVFVLIFLLICIFFGLYGSDTGAHGQEEEEPQKEAGYMDAQVEDVPLNQELENILEMSNEDYETSRGSYAELRPLRVSRGESIVASYDENMKRK